MIRILKLPLRLGHNVHDLLAVEVLSVAWQGPQLVLWAEVYCDEQGQPYPATSEPEALQLYVAETGERVPGETRERAAARREYVGTATLLADRRPYVVHVYQLRQVP